MPRGIPDGLWSPHFGVSMEGLKAHSSESIPGKLWGSPFGVFMGHKVWKCL